MPIDVIGTHIRDDTHARNDTHVRASLREGRFARCVDPPNNYELCIMNYVLIISCSL